MGTKILDKKLVEKRVYDWCVELTTIKISHEYHSRAGANEKLVDWKNGEIQRGIWLIEKFIFN